MALHDYSEEDDYYSQGFERAGVLSIWASVISRPARGEVDTLQDLCGVGYYNLDDQEAVVSGEEFEDISLLISKLSFSSSFVDGVVAAARAASIEKAMRVLVQYDFAYDPSVVNRKIEDDPIFLGVFPYRGE